uniref:2-aminoethylphosphonate aminotransferase n=1 Tax=Oceanispirochaeta sp. TaxID=2035350 RepID=UPI00261FC79A
MKEVERKILLNPGPATTTDSVKWSQVIPDICPREHEFAGIVDDIIEGLTDIAADNQDYVSVLFGGSGTAGVESTLCSVPENAKLLIISNGAYGRRMCTIADTYRLDYQAYSSSEYTPLDLSAIEDLVKKGSFTHLFVVHHETTTGLLNDIESLGRIAKAYDLRFVVDAMSSFAGIPIDMKQCHIDFLVASSNKNIQGMAGLVFVIASKEALEELADQKARGFYLDLYNQFVYYRDKKQFRFTPPVQTVYALHQALKEFQEESLQGRYDRYCRLWKIMTEGMQKLGFKMLVEEAYQSKMITAFMEPETIGYSFDDLHDFLFEKGITIYPGKAMGIN